MRACKMTGLVLRFKRWHIRVWSKGIEFGNGLGGRVYIFPWIK